MQTLPPAPLTPNPGQDNHPPLLNLDEQVLLRAWIRGVPLAALGNPANNATFRQLAGLRERLYLKAKRLQCPEAGLWLQRHNLQAWERQALASLDLLLHAADLEPRADDPLENWLAPAWAAALNQAGVSTLAALAGRVTAGGSTWWQAIPGLGRVSARQLQQQLIKLWPGGLTPKPPALPVYATAVVPLERFLLPESLDGRHGRNRAPEQPFIPLPHDLAAIGAWLARLVPGSHTHRAYRREAERLLLWAILAQGKALAGLDTTDLAAYRQFLQDPQPAQAWVGPPQHKAHPDWKPFTGPLSRRSVQQAETIIGSLFDFLVLQRYLLHNPLSALPRLKAPGQGLAGVQRVFTLSEWHTISATAAQQATQGNPQARRRALRTQLILHLAFATGLRLHELVQVTLADLITVGRTPTAHDPQAPQAGATAQHWLSLVGKGQKRREVPLPPATWAFIQENYRALTGRRVDRQPSGYPLIPALHDARKAVTPLAVHKALKAFFKDLAETLQDTQPETAQHLLKASTHWLRHTHGSLAAAQGVPLAMVRDNLGHASIATTSQYLHAEADARYGAYLEWLEPPSLLVPVEN